MKTVIEITRGIDFNLLIWLTFSIVIYAPVSDANGWEHTSIDFEVLQQALNDANPNVRRRAAESLGFRQQAGATEALLARLEKDEPVASVRQEIYGALGRLGESQAIDSMRNCLENEGSAALRSQCAGALGNFDSQAAELLALRAADDENHQVRSRAIASLGYFSSAATIRYLINLARDSDDPRQHLALHSLGRTRAAAATEVLVDLLENSTNPVQTIVVLQAFILLGDPDASGVIQALYRSSDDERIKQYALVAMASARASGSESYFLDALSSENHASRVLGLVALRKMGSPGQIEIISRHAIDDSSDLFSQGSEQLLNDPVATIASLDLLNEYLKTIIQLAPEAGESVYLQATTAVSIPRTSSAALKIAEGFYKARWQSVYGLGYTESAQAIKHVAQAMKDPDFRIRAVAIRSMGVLGNRENLGLVEAMLGDEMAEVRWTAARVLGRMRASESIEALMQSLDDDHAQVRLESVTALGYLGATMARSKIAQTAAEDPDPGVREAAVYAASLIE